MALGKGAVRMIGVSVGRWWLIEKYFNVLTVEPPFDPEKLDAISVISKRFVLFLPVIESLELFARMMFFRRRSYR